MKITIDTRYLKHLNAAGVIYLAYLNEHPNATISDMEIELHRSYNTIQQQIKKLADYGFIKRIYGTNHLGRTPYGNEKMIGAKILK